MHCVLQAPFHTFRGETRTEWSVCTRHVKALYGAHFRKHSELRWWCLTHTSSDAKLSTNYLQPKENSALTGVHLPTDLYHFMNKHVTFHMCLLPNSRCVNKIGECAPAEVSPLLRQRSRELSVMPVHDALHCVVFCVALAAEGCSPCDKLICDDANGPHIYR